MEIQRNAHKTIVFRKFIEAGASGYLQAPIVSHGIIKAVTVQFAVGEAGTLHLRPVVELPSEISLDLFQYATDGLQYISGDDEKTKSSVQYEVENNSTVKVFYENVGDAESFLSVDVEIMYFEVAEPDNIIGPQQTKRRGWFNG